MVRKVTYGGTAYGVGAYGAGGYGGVARRLATRPVAELVELRDRLEHLDLEAEPEAAAVALTSVGVPEPTGGWLRDRDSRMELVAWVGLLIAILSWMFPRTAETPPPRPDKEQIEGEMQRQHIQRQRRPREQSSQPNDEATRTKDDPTSH